MISVDTNILERASGQLENFEFDSMVVFDGKLVLAGSSGIMEQDNSGADNEVDITAWGKTGTSDLGIVRQKRLRKAYTGYEAYGAGATIGFYFDESLGYTQTLAPTNGVQEIARVNCRRSGKGSFLAFLFSNVSGADFSLNSLSVVPVILMTKPQGT